MKTILTVLLVITWSARGESNSTLVVTPTFINQLAEALRTNHPSLKAEEHKVVSARQNSRSIQTWEDPMVVLGGMGARRMMRMEEGDLIYGVEQKLPLFGKPRAEKNVAAAEVKVAEMSQEARFQELRRQLAKNLLLLALADEALRLRRADLQWLEASYKIAHQQYLGGEATQVQVLRFQTELEKARSVLESQTELRQQNLAVVRRLLNDESFSPPSPLALPPIADDVPLDPKLISLALKFEPELRLMRDERSVAVAEAEVTRKARLPEVLLGAEARNYVDDGSFRQGMVTLSVSLPFANWGKYRAAHKRDLEKITAIDFQITDRAQQVATEVQDVVTKISVARREGLLYRDKIIPQTERAFESLQAGWQVNRGMIQDLFETRRMLIENRLMYVKATAEQYDMIAELILCCGVADLEALEMLGLELKPQKGE